MFDVIGGEFEISFDNIINKVPIKDNIFISKNVLYSTGRGALYYILQDIKKNNPLFRTILLPDFLCSSIIDTVEAVNFSIEYYHIKENLYPDLNNLLTNLHDNKVLLLIDYFSLINLEPYIKEIKNVSKACIIFDKVQSLFSIKEKSLADYCFTSFRKWFAVPDGAIIESQIFKYIKAPINNSFVNYKISGSVLKDLRNNLFDCDDIYLSLFKQGEEILNQNYLGLISDLTKNLLNNIDLDEIKAKRMKNYKYLYDNVINLGYKTLAWEGNSTPLFLPIFIKDRNLLREAFFKEKIYTPIHWTKSTKVDSVQILYNTELSLIIDQRYSISDMNRIIEVLKKWKQK